MHERGSSGVRRLMDSLLAFSFRVERIFTTLGGMGMEWKCQKKGIQPFFQVSVLVLKTMSSFHPPFGVRTNINSSRGRVNMRRARSTLFAILLREMED